ncbi:hypothetical protein DBR06_SOUSAS76410001, partial [Sousa chinensis]
MTPSLTALLCLGEMEEGEGKPQPGMDPSPQPGCSVRRPQDSGGSRVGEALLRIQGEPLTGVSLPGLSVGLRTQVQAGTLPKPTIWAEPGSVIPWGSPVTIRCQGTRGVREFRLDKEGSSPPWDRQPSLVPGDKGKFSISYMTQDYAGRYHCYYLSPTGWSESSGPLELVVTGENVTLLCQSGSTRETFLLFKEGAAQPPQRLRSKYRGGHFQAEFSMSPVTSAHNGTYSCYSSLSSNPYLLSHASAPLELMVSGEGPQPCPLCVP